MPIQLTMTILTLLLTVAATFSDQQSTGLELHHPPTTCMATRVSLLPIYEENLVMAHSGENRKYLCSGIN